MSFHQPPATYINEVRLKVKNLHQSSTFYQETLGLQLLQQTERLVILSADGKSPLISLEEPENISEKQPRTTGLYHFALLLPTRAELAVLLNHLLKQKYPLQGASDHLVSEAVYLADPDGNGIEIYIDRPPSEWDWEGEFVKMAVDPLDAEDLLSEANGHNWSGISPATIMGHIHMHVSDLAEAETFYCGALGFATVSKLGNQALFVSSHDYHHHIGLNTWAGVGSPAPKKTSAGIDWYEINYPTLEARKNVLNKLSELDFLKDEIEGEFFTKDPAGNKIKLSVKQK